MADVTRNREAEQAVIGIACQDAASAAQVAALPENLFSDPACIALHAGVATLVRQGKAVDAISLSEAAACDALPDPSEAVCGCLCVGFSPAMLGTYTAILQACRKRRACLDTANMLLTRAAHPGEDQDALAAEAVKALQDEDAAGDDTADMAQSLYAMLEELDGAKTGRCYTGLADFDRATGGFKGGKLVILAARPGVGKSALALHMAAYVARHTGPVLLLSMEMGKEEIMARLVAAAAQVNVEHIEAASLTPEELDAMAAVYKDISALPLRITERATTPLTLRRVAMAMKRRDGLAMVVVDYLQLMRADHRLKSRYEEVSEISRELKLLAADLDCPVLALCQLNRQSDGGNGKAEKRPPLMSEARDSGSIEQDANIFLTLFEPSEPDRQNEAIWRDYNACKSNGMAMMVLDLQKNRQGRTGSFRIGFRKPTMQFFNLSRERPSPERDKIYCISPCRDRSCHRHMSRAPEDDAAVSWAQLKDTSYCKHTQT